MHKKDFKAGTGNLPLFAGLVYLSIQQVNMMHH